ncbi:MAG TPA: sigma-70 family RNA polymerase sigma factor [Mobilitalea sp.]|nr:sigma-70 family RNA polymerase sigma factor [Mobilitalea sp.]
MNDLKLIRACQNGEKQAFNELITLYYPYVSKFLLKLTMDEAVNEDLVQETFLKLIRNIDKFDINGKASFATYLITIAKNCYFDYLRKNKNTFLDLDDQVIEASTMVEETVLKKLEYDDVLKALESLSWEQGQAIKLKYLEDMTLQEIADIFHTQPKTIKSRIHDGMVKLRKNLDKGGNKNG